MFRIAFINMMALTFIYSCECTIFIYGIITYTNKIHQSLRWSHKSFLWKHSFWKLFEDLKWRASWHILTISSSSSKSPSSSSPSRIIISIVIVIIEGHLLPKGMLPRCHQVASRNPTPNRTSDATYRQLEQTMFGLKWRQNSERRTLFIIWGDPLFWNYFQLRIVRLKSCIHIVFYFTGS